MDNIIETSINENKNEKLIEILNKIDEKYLEETTNIIDILDDKYVKLQFWEGNNTSIWGRTQRSERE